MTTGWGRGDFATTKGTHNQRERKFPLSPGRLHTTTPRPLDERVHLTRSAGHSKKKNDGKGEELEKAGKKKFARSARCTRGKRRREKSIGGPKTPEKSGEKKNGLNYAILPPSRNWDFIRKAWNERPQRKDTRPPKEPKVMPDTVPQKKAGGNQDMGQEIREEESGASTVFFASPQSCNTITPLAHQKGKTRSERKIGTAVGLTEKEEKKP